MCLLAFFLNTRLLSEWRIDLNLMKILAPAIAVLLLAAACSSPAVTGIKVHIQNSEYQDAIHLADSVIAGGEGENPEVWYWRGRAYSMMRDWEGAAESFMKAYELDPAIGANLTSYWPAFYNTAATYVQDERIDDAMSMLETGKSIVPSRPEFDQLIGDIALNNHEYEQALVGFETSIDLAVAQIEALQATLEVSLDPEPIMDEIDRMRASVVLSSFNSGSILKNFYMNAETVEEADEFMAQAVDIYSQALAIDPSSADLMTGLAEFYILSEQFNEALGIYDDALIAIQNGVDEGWISEEDASSMRASVMLTRGFTFIEMERYDEGIQALEECRATLGDTYQVLAMIGHANFIMENYNQSIEVMMQLADKDGLAAEEYGNAWYMIYANYIRLEKDSDALQAIQNAIQYVDDNPDYYEYLAQTYSTLGRNQQAMDAMAKAESLR